MVPFTPRETQGQFRPYVENIHSVALLHHSFHRLQRIVKELKGPDGFAWHKELRDDDFPLIDAVYRGTPVTLVTTRMGVDLSLWVAHQLISCGARRLMKLGTFLSLNDEDVQVGDVYAPSESIVLPGPVEAYLGQGTPRVGARGQMIELLLNKRLQNGAPVRTGTVLTYPVLDITTAHPAYQVEFWRRSCFGLEMECSAIFAVAHCFKIQSAALLICNRRWDTIAAEQTKGAWNPPPRPEAYENNYLCAARIALDVLVTP
jgi:uridine phosphorylase